MIITPEEFDYKWFRKIKTQKKPSGNPGNKRKIHYKDIVTAFDIETTRLDDLDQSIMYIWQWQFGDKCTVIGRTWEEFTTFRDRLSECMKGRLLVVYVHNLSYEFQFLSGIYDFMPEEVFPMDSRKILKCEMSGFLEFRCSYIHSNMSLKMYTEKMGAEHAKLSGREFDYSIKRYPWTKLTDQELKYCVNDVLGLVEALTIEMAHDGDNLYTIPLTSTGYVRRDAKHAMQKISHYFVKNQLPDIVIYEMCREAFRGGNAHANRFYAGKILHNVKSADRSSSYPDVQCNDEFPVGPFFKAGAMTIEELNDYIKKRHKAVLMRVRISKIRLHDKFWGCPYLSRDKCRDIIDGVYDNGRILMAEYLETTITDVDFRIILSEYDFDSFDAYDVAFARYGKLPRPLIDTTIDYYVKKTSLKGVEGEELLYLKSKNKLNSIYGMMAQDPVKTKMVYDNHEYIEKEEPKEDILARSNRRAFLCYQWGVWVTAWARYRLEEGIRLAGDNFVYCDTDSVKYMGDIDWTWYNNKRIKASTKSGAHATDPKGNEHYMGVYEYEGEYSEFSTLGAKKYCWREGNGPLMVTIAGVEKAEGGPELEKAGGISAFRPGFIFRGAGGTESVYNDFPEVLETEIEGHTLSITSNVVIKESTYTLGITHEYMRLLERSSLAIDKY